MSTPETLPRPTRILVVEDEGIVAKDIQNRLRTLGYEVPVTVSTGAAAIDAVAEYQPDVVLMDIMLRGNMDGVQATEIITAQHSIPVIYLTAYSDENTIRRAKITEPFGYILKPFSERELQTTIEMALYKHRMDSRIRANERWLSTTLRSIGDGVISADQEGRVLFMNAEAEELTGWSITEAAGRQLDEVLHVERHSPDIDSADAMLLAHNGSSVSVDMHRSPIANEQGEALGEVVVVHDVSERVNAQSELKRQRDLYESLLRAQSDMGEGFAILENARFQYVNDAYAGITGYTSEELLAMPSAFDLIVPEDRETIFGMEQLRKKGEIVPNVYEMAIMHKAGRRVVVEISSNYPDPKSKRHIGLVRDVTDRNRAQAELVQTQLRLTTLFKNLPSVVLYETGGGREYISENIEQLLGYPLAKFKEDRNMFPSLMHPDDTKRVGQILVDWHAGGERGVLNYQFRARKADGTFVWLEDHMVEVKPAAGVKYMTGVMIDITERKLVEEELRIAKERAEEYDRLKTNFISVISHEIRTPLNAILGCTKLVNNAVHDAADRQLEQTLQEYFSIVDRSGERLMKLIESFLDIAAIQAGNLKLRLDTHRVETVVREAVDELRLRIQDANLDLTEEYNAKEAFALIDAARLAQVITNVLANAVKFTPRGSIRVRTSEENGNAIVTITDTGIGISPTFLPNLFAPFRQGSEGSTRGYQGAGLGLSVAHRLTEAMGGEVSVESELGKGTTVRMQFPLVSPVRSPSAVTPPKTLSDRPQRIAIAPGGRALVVEDDYENMMYVRTVLRTTGWIVETATNGDDALRLMKENRPSLVLMDINLTGSMTGFDALVSIRNDPSLAKTPVIAVTAHAFEEQRVRIMEAGFTDYLAKPFSPDQLREIIAKHIQQQLPRPSGRGL